MTFEGWYVDPSGRHEARWYSVGSPTELVRDGQDETSDDPSDITADLEPTVLPEPETGGADLRRADEAVAGGSAFEPAHDGMTAVIDSAGASGVGS